MHKISATTHKFRRGKVPGDGLCCFWSIIVVFNLFLIYMLIEDPSNAALLQFLVDILYDNFLQEGVSETLFKKGEMKELNKKLREQVARYILRDKEKHVLVLAGGTNCKTIEKYCDRLKSGKLWGGHHELEVLSHSNNIAICVICMSKSNGNRTVWPTGYDLDNPLATKCVFLLYDGEKEGEEHYDPLYVVNTQNPNEKETVFERNDKDVIELIKKFIKEDLKYDGNIDRDFFNRIVVHEVLPRTDDLKEFEKISDLLLPNLPSKRKTIELEDIVSPPNKDKQLPVSMSDQYYNQNKRVKVEEDTTELDKDDAESMKIESLIQGEHIANEPDQPMNQQQIEDRPVVSNEEPQEGKMDLEIKPGQELDCGDKFKYDNELSKEKLSS